MTNQETIERFFDVLNSHKPEQLSDVLAADFLFEGVAGPGAPSREALSHELELIFAGLPDLTFRPVRQEETPEGTVIEFRAMGTHRGDFLNVPPTNTFAIVSGVFTLETDDRIRRLRLTLDFGGLRRQLLMAARRQP